MRAIPSASASLSMFASCAKQTCGAPNPRIAPQGGLLEYTAVPSISAFGTSYGPAMNEVAFPTTAGEELANAPPSTTIRPRTATSFRSEEHTFELQSRQYLVCR